MPVLFFFLPASESGSLHADRDRFPGGDGMSEPDAASDDAVIADHGIASKDGGAGVKEHGQSAEQRDEIEDIHIDPPDPVRQS